MIRLKRIDCDAERPEQPDPKPPGPVVTIPAKLLGDVLAALDGFAHSAGDAAMLGRHDEETVHPMLTAGHYRRARAVRRELMEFARDAQRQTPPAVHVEPPPALRAPR